jgi:hypothetical protein
MPFVDTNDDVFLGEKSFATCMRPWTVMRPFRAQEFSPDMARRGAALSSKGRMYG